MTQIAALSAASRPAAAAPASSEREQLAQAARAFEAVFMRQLLGTMRSASLGEDVAGSAAVDQFRELADARLSDSMSQQGNLGIAELILQQLDKKP
ncbi:conserved hypothetical protein [Sphingobium sp. SYK-6]|uniref:rod-binding protein n=1 Tax=Sphingobium sp. (strain NBRC 103272 / SYK-6) TaxID=627192 RepID=UPI00022773A5|nr:rod-binding protein [Sphingobium sp. SYK-6]BAK65992.1 conserved hypothetical protein [Sphingobium sp. SYK-6]